MYVRHVCAHVCMFTELLQNLYNLFIEFKVVSKKYGYHCSNGEVTTGVGGKSSHMTILYMYYISWIKFLWFALVSALNFMGINFRG